MTRSASLAKFLSVCGLWVVGVLILLGGTLRIQTYLFQRRAERLMADFQRLRLQQSQWTHAERLISTWGKFGHYEGDCTDSFCRYRIVLESPEMRRESTASAKQRKGDFFPWASSMFVTLCEIFGERSAILKTTMVVQDGVVVRKSAVFIYDVLPQPVLAGVIP
jgi:hypothetical protein